MLTLNDGVVNGNGTDVSGEPLAFRVVGVSKRELVLRPEPENASATHWRLYACPQDAR